MKFNILYIDSPWQYKDKQCIQKNSALTGEDDQFYETMDIEKIKKLPLNNISHNNCLCFSWVVSPMLKQGIEVLESWGFKYTTIAFVWYKERPNSGYYTMSECEICIVGKKGKIPTPRGARNIRQFYFEKKTEHSKKPDEFRKRIEKMFPNHPKIEIFAREIKPNWYSIGNEIDKFDIYDSIEMIANKQDDYKQEIKQEKTLFD